MNARSLFLLIIFAALIPIQANAFDVFGYHSGMNRKEVAAYTARMGLDSWAGPKNMLAVGNERAGRVDGALGFCKDVLVSYHRPIASDNEYFATLREFGMRYGPPSKVKASGGGEWSDQGNSEFQTAFVMTWYRGNDRITLTTYPEGHMEWRDGMGNFRHARQPTLDFFTRNPCGD